MSASQYIRTDLLVVEKNGGNAELQLKNATRDVEGFLYNVGEGVTEFRAINANGYHLYRQYMIEEGGEIEPGATTYQNDDFIGWDVHLFYDDKILYNDITGRLSYSNDPETGTIVWTAGLEEGKPLRIYLDRPLVVPPVPLHIVTNPSTQEIDEGDPVAFTVAAGGGTAPYTYQWKKDGANISGATGTTYTITEVGESDEADYSCQVIDNVGATVTSDPATLTMIPAPTPPDFAFVSQPVDQTVTVGHTFTLSATIEGGTPPYVFDWHFPGGSGNNGPHTSPVNNLNWVATVTQDWYVVVTDSLGAEITSDTATITVESDLAISSQTASPQIFEEGGELYLFVTASAGSPGYTYQWKKDGGGLAGQTATSIDITGITMADAGTYTCVVTDSASATVTSDPIVVTIVEPEEVTIDRYYGDADPYVDDSTAPTPLTNHDSITTAPGAGASIMLPAAASEKFVQFRQPANEPAFTAWSIGDATGSFSFDAVFRNPFIVDGFRYYVSRDPAGFVFDPAYPLLLTH